MQAGAPRRVQAGSKVSFFVIFMAELMRKYGLQVYEESLDKSLLYIREECKSVPREECKAVTRQECNTIQKPVTYTVPENKCYDVENDVCVTVSRQECKTVQDKVETKVNVP